MTLSLRTVTVLAASASMWVVALAATPSTQARRPGELPPGEGRDLVISLCGDCHGPEKVTDVRRSRAEWQDMVQDMASRAGVATPDDITAIVQYVVVHFGKVNVNRGAEADLAEIANLTASEASAIVEFRKQQGDYRTLEDLRNVPGLDFARIQERKDRLGFTGP
jgi:competence protein ComEA